MNLARCRAAQGREAGREDVTGEIALGPGAVIHKQVDFAALWGRSDTPSRDPRGEERPAGGHPDFGKFRDRLQHWRELPGKKQH